MTTSKTPDELADALWKKKQLYGAPSASKAELRQLSRDAAALGAVKALEIAQEQLVRHDSFSERTLRIIDEVIATYTDQEQGK